MLFCIVGNIISSSPSHIVAGSFHRPPFVLVFTGDLVPERNEIGPHLAVCSDIPQELIGSFGNLGF